MTKRLMSDEIEKMALEIVDFLIKYRLWVDVSIFFNGKEYTTEDPATGKFFYNDKNHLIVIDNVKLDDFVEDMVDVNPDHILSMSFDSRLYEVLNYSLYEIDDGQLKAFHERDEYVYKIQEEFRAIFEKYGVYFLQWKTWNLTCYYENN